MSTKKGSIVKNNIGRALNVFRKRKNLTLEEMGAIINTSASYLSQVERGKKMPGSEIIISLKDNFPELDLNELFQSKNNDVDIEQLIIKESHTHQEVPKEIEKASIPVYRSIQASAGDGIIPEVEKDLIYIGMPRTFIHDELHTTPANLFVMPVQGDSMEPTIKDGDYIIVNKQVGRPLAGHIFLVRIDESILCKRLHELPSKRLRVSSDNQYYESFEVPADQDNFEIIGRVVWFSRQI